MSRAGTPTAGGGDLNRAVADVRGAAGGQQAAGRAASGARAARAQRTRRRPKVRPLDVVAVIFMILLLAFSVIPLAWMFSTSLKTQFAAIQQPPRGSRRRRRSTTTGT